MAAIDSGLVPGPRIHVTTPYLTGPEGGGSMSIAASPEQARRFVAYWAAEGATWVKFYTDISRASMKAAIDEAHKQGIKATGHLCSVTFQEAIDLGIDDFAHDVLTASDFIADKQPDKCPNNVYKQLDSLVSGDSPLAKSLIQSMISHKVSMTTTMAIYEALSPGRPVQDERSLELMTPVVRAAYVKNRAYIDSMPGYMFTKDGFARALAFDKAFYAAGGVMASGVDPTGNGGALPGFGDQRGYELLRESGLTAEQAVQVVSFNGARMLGVDDEARLGGEGQDRRPGAAQGRPGGRSVGDPQRGDGIQGWRGLRSDQADRRRARTGGCRLIVAFLGLGQMGQPIARNLVVGGFDVRTWNRSGGSVEGATACRTIEEAVRPAAVVVTMLSEDAAVRAVTFGEGKLAASLRTGGIHVGMSTISVALATELATTHAEGGQRYVNAPVFGRPDRAASKQLFVVPGGSAADIAELAPLFAAVGQGTFPMPGAAESAIAKLCGNFMLAATARVAG